jgi:hypothetical protein
MKLRATLLNETTPSIPSLLSLLTFWITFGPSSYLIFLKNIIYFVIIYFITK